VTNLKIDIAIPVLNDTNIRDTLHSLANQFPTDGLTVLISDNSSDSDIGSIVSEFRNQLNIRYFRQKRRVSFEANLIAALKLGSGDVVTCCGAGDDLNLEHLVRASSLLAADRSLDMVGGCLSINNSGTVYRNTFLDFQLGCARDGHLNRSDLSKWIILGPLSSIGSWIIRRAALEESLHYNPIDVEGTKFPQIAIVLGIRRDLCILQTPYSFFEITEEIDPSRQKNAIYAETSWIGRLLALVEVEQNERQREVKEILGRVLRVNLISFKAFGGRKSLDSVCLQLQALDPRRSTQLRCKLVSLLPTKWCFLAVRVYRKVRAHMLAFD
jgi:glycosyltransferase involved in cell wall biosynthesis